MSLRPEVDFAAHLFCPTQLALRRESSAFASTSQPRRSFSSIQSYRYDYRDHNNSEAKVLSIPWKASSGESQDDYESQRGSTGQKDTEAADNRAGVGRAKAKALKINRDLLLYRARKMRQKAFQMKRFTERAEATQQAEAILRRCIDLDPTDARAYNSLGKHLQTERRFEEAGKVYDDGLAVSGGQNAHLWQSWAILEGKMGNVSQARKYFKAAVLVDPAHAAAWHAWGMLEKREGNLVKARDIWIKGVKKVAGAPNPHLYSSLAVLAGEMGFTEEARAWFKQGTSSIRGAKSHALWHGWAQMEERSGDTRVVRFLYRKGLEVSPNSRYIHLAWAMFEKAEGRFENARALLKRGHELNPNDGAILQAWALLEDESGDVALARRLFEDASKVDPRMVHVWQAWGVMELRAGNFNHARKLFQSAVWASNTNADACKVWQAWAILESRAGNVGLARSMHSCAVKADPDSDTAWESWIKMEDSLEQYVRAERLVKARSSGKTVSEAPLSFIKLGTVENAEPSLVESIVSTVSEWLRKFDSKRQAVQQRPPSYLKPPRNDEIWEEQEGEQLETEDMIGFDDDDLDVSALPRRRLKEG